MLKMITLAAVLLLAGCHFRGSLPAGHDGGSFADDLGSGLVWLVLICLLGAGMSAAAAVLVVSTVKGFASIMWAICFGFLATIGGALVLGVLAPAIPWIIGGLAVVGGGVYGLHHWRGLVALWQGVRSSPAPSPVAPAILSPT